jgi:hypothetical protein
MFSNLYIHKIAEIFIGIAINPISIENINPKDFILNEPGPPGLPGVGDKFFNVFDSDLDLDTFVFFFVAISIYSRYKNNKFNKIMC